jgi:thymidylate synthase ThyX
LITKLYSSELEEFRGVGKTMQEELSKVIPSFVKRANDKHGQSMQQYWKSNLDAVDAFACPINEHSGEAGVFLVESETEDHSIGKLVKYILFSQMNSSISKINEKIGKMNREEKLQIINSYVGERQNRRQKPSRAFEHVNYTFEIVANYGAYRDLHRHRILTQQRQLLTPYLGYKMPKEIAQAGFESEFKEVMKKARETFESMYSKYPNQAQYVVPLAYNIRWYMNLNLREAYHLIELRSAMQGHIDYREIVQKMFGQIEKVHPNLAKGMKFVDMKEYALERLEAEKRIDKKMEELGEKYKK